MKRLSQAEWIERASIIHNNKYNYNNVIYLSGNKKVSIICSVHGEFLQKANNHIFLKRGCPKCSNGVILSREEFISKCVKKHDYFFDYSKTNFQGVKKKIIIICPIHGEFQQIAEKHFLYGCAACAGNKPLSIEEFLNRANKVHNNKFNYSLVSKIEGICSKVKIICQVHGCFEQTIKNHLSGRGCKYCSVGNSSKKEQLWLDYCKVPNTSLHRNVKITIDGINFCVDGVFQKEKIIYEFLGDFWHGHPIRYDPNRMNSMSKKLFGVLFKNTVERIKLFRKNGYKVISIWESRFDRFNK